MCCINHDKRKTSMCSQYYLNISSTGAHDVGWEDTHHVESISQFIWNLLRNGICQSWKSSISSSVSRMLSNIKHWIRRGPSRNSSRRNQRVFLWCLNQPLPFGPTSIHPFSALPPAHSEDTTVCRNVPGSLLASLLPDHLPILSESVSEQSVWGETWVCFWTQGSRVHTCFSLVWHLLLLEFLMTPWRSWAVAWRNYAHHCPPCLANVRSSHCEAESRTQIFDQNPQSQSLPFPMSAPRPGSPFALNWEYVAMREEHSTPFPLSAHIPEMRVGYVAWTWCRCCKIVVSSAVLSLVSSQEIGGGRKTSQLQHSWVTCRNSAPDVCRI